MTIDDIVMEGETPDLTIVEVVEAYVKHSPQSRRGPVTLKNWFAAYDTNTGKRTGKGQGNKYYARWHYKHKNTEFDEWIKQQLPNKLRKQLEQTSYFTQQEFSIENIVKAYIKHNPHGNRGPITLKNWFAAYDITTGKCIHPHKIGHGSQHYKRWKADQKTQFDEWVKQQIPGKLARQLEQTPYYKQKEFSIENIVKAYIKHQPQNYKGPTPLKNWFLQYDIKTGKHTKKGQGKKYYERWYNLEKKPEFGEWVKQQIPGKLARQLEQTPYYQQQFSIEDIVKTYIKNEPTSIRGPVPLKNWFAQYDINTGKHTKKGQGRKYYNRWLENEKDVDFDEWILKQVSAQTQNDYFRQIHGVEDGTQVLRALEQVIEGKVIERASLDIPPVKRMLTAFFIEKDVHPLVAHFTPYQAMIYLSKRPEDRPELTETA